MALVLNANATASAVSAPGPSAKRGKVFAPKDPCMISAAPRAGTPVCRQTQTLWPDSRAPRQRRSITSSGQNGFCVWSSAFRRLPEPPEGGTPNFSRQNQTRPARRCSTAVAGFWTARLTLASRRNFRCQITGQAPVFRAFSASSFCSYPAGFRGPCHAKHHGMTRIAYNVSRKSRIFNTALVPANHSEEARFGPIDGAVIVFFLLCVAGFICFLVA